MLLPPGRASADSKLQRHHISTPVSTNPPKKTIPPSNNTTANGLPEVCHATRGHCKQPPEQSESTRGLFTLYPKALEATGGLIILPNTLAYIYRYLLQSVYEPTNSKTRFPSPHGPIPANPTLCILAPAAHANPRNQTGAPTKLFPIELSALSTTEKRSLRKHRKALNVMLLGLRAEMSNV